MSTIEVVTERLDGLERENRRLRGILMALLAGAVGLGGLAVFPRERGGRKIETQQLVLRDREGRLRGTFGVDRDGLPSLKLYDHRGLEQVELGVQSDDFAALTLSNRGAPRIMIDTSSLGYSSVRLFDAEQAEKATLVVKPDSTVGLRLSGADQSLGLAIAPDGRMTIPTVDAQGREVERILPANRSSAYGGDLSAASLAVPIGPKVVNPVPPAGVERGDRNAARGMSH
jgi:hypothetical protein